jgi:hypothetical protein
MRHSYLAHYTLFSRSASTFGSYTPIGSLRTYIPRWTTLCPYCIPVWLDPIVHGSYVLKYTLFCISP